MDETTALFVTVKAETESLLQKQRRNGLEYRFKDGVGRPVVLTKSQLTAAEPTLDAPTSRSAGGRDTARSAGGARARVQSGGPPRADTFSSALKSADSAAVRLTDYDPKQIMVRDHRLLVESVAQLRAEASRTHHESERLALKSREADAELAKIKNEDAVGEGGYIFSIRRCIFTLFYTTQVADEHAAWRQTMRAYKVRTEVQHEQLREVEAYHATLQHMLSRGLRDRVLQQSTLSALEEGLRVHEREEAMHANVLQQVIRSRDTELGELGRVRAETARFLSVLDAKLEARRVEVKSRQDKARWRLMKLASERAMKSKAEGELTAEEERAMITTAQNLAQDAAALVAAKMRTQASADAAEGLFHHVRFAAGSPGPGPDAMVTAEGEPFEMPDTEAIVLRFAALEGDVAAVGACGHSQSHAHSLFFSEGLLRLYTF